MSKIQISELTEASAVLDSDWLAIEDENGTATKKISVENFNATATVSAKGYAEAAAQSATAASGYKADAKDYKDEATIQAGNAADSATAASGYASSAQGYATEASGYVGTAFTHASNASNSAASAAASTAEAENKANLAKSWAIGETGLRVDEAVNNARYWASVAQSIAGGGVNSFNGRGGAVVPQAHDYDANQVDYDNTTSGLAATNTQAAIDEVVGNLNTLASSLGTAATKDSTSTISQGSTDVAEAGAVYTELAKKEDVPTELTATLSASATSLTFSNAAITTNSTIDVYASIYGIAPTAIAVTTGQAVLTFDPQQSAVDIKLVVR